LQIAAARGWLRLSQAKLAQRTKIALRTINHFEAGERLPYRRTVDALVAYLHERGVEFLMDGDVGVGIKVVKIIEDPETKMIRTRDGPMQRFLSIAIVLSLLLVAAA
jgi:transcriptional regulator with XRE-family HTH domain